ncbi:MAG: hypothetical protein V2G41_09920 [bacterium JZ-2024 1]
MRRTQPYLFQISHVNVSAGGTNTANAALAVGNYEFHVHKLTAVAVVASSGALLQSECTFRLQRDSSEFLSSSEISTLTFQQNPWIVLSTPWVLYPNSYITSVMSNNTSSAVTLRIVLEGILIQHGEVDQWTPQ